MCRPACWAMALLLQSHDKVSYAGTKPKADFDLHVLAPVFVSEPAPSPKPPYQPWHPELPLCVGPADHQHAPASTMAPAS